MAAELRVWALPEAPGPDVHKLRDRYGTEYVREDGQWTSAPNRPGNGWYWEQLLVSKGPLTEVP